jgi:hypothetical protein
MTLSPGNYKQQQQVGKVHQHQHKAVPAFKGSPEKKVDKKNLGKKTGQSLSKKKN